MAETGDKIGWAAILISTVLQVFSYLKFGTGLLTTFNDIPEVTDAASGFSALLAFVVDLFQVVSGFFVQNWANSFPAWLHFVIAIILDLPIILLLAATPVVLVIVGIAAIVGALADLVPI